jgi:hypothetical protein
MNTILQPIADTGRSRRKSHAAGTLGDLSVVDECPTRVCGGGLRNLKREKHEIFLPAKDGSVRWIGYTHDIGYDFGPQSPCLFRNVRTGEVWDRSGQRRTL